MSTLKAIGRFFQWLFCCGSKESRNDNDKNDKGFKRDIPDINNSIPKDGGVTSNDEDTNDEKFTPAIPDHNVSSNIDDGSKFDVGDKEPTPKATKLNNNNNIQPKPEGKTASDDYEAILSEVKKDYKVLYKHRDLLSNKDFMLDAIVVNPEALKAAPLKKNPQFLLDALNRNQQILKYIYMDSLKEHLLISTIKEHPEWLVVDDFVMSDVFKLEAITQNPKAAQYMKFESFIHDNLLLEILEKHFDAFQYIKSKLLNRADFMLKAVEKDPRALAFASGSLKSNKLFLCQSYDANRNVFKECGDALPYKSEEEIFIAAVEETDNDFIWNYNGIIGQIYGNPLTDFKFLTKVAREYPEQLKSMHLLRGIYEEVRGMHG